MLTTISFFLWRCFYIQQIWPLRDLCYKISGREGLYERNPNNHTISFNIQNGLRKSFAHSSWFMWSLWCIYLIGVCVWFCLIFCASGCVPPFYVFSIVSVCVFCGLCCDRVLLESTSFLRFKLLILLLVVLNFIVSDVYSVRLKYASLRLYLTCFVRMPFIYAWEDLLPSKGIP